VVEGESAVGKTAEAPKTDAADPRQEGSAFGVGVLEV
jgi:hypothetical protein